MGLKASSVQIVVLSNSLTTLDVGECRTSSELFQLGLARALSRHVRTIIISTSADTRSQSDGVELIGIGGSGSLVGKVRTIARGNDLLTDGKNILLMYGYDPRTIAALKIVGRGQRTKLVSYVFDTHIVAIEHKRFPRKQLIDLYYRLGLRMLRRVDGLLLLNQRAYNQLGVDATPFLVSRVGVWPSAIRSSTAARLARNRGQFRVVYTGSLESCNGVVPLLESMQYIKDQTVTLDIFGTGSLSDQVGELAAHDNRINYHGVTKKSVVDEVVREADLLVNLRDLDHPVAAYSFPSKLVEYMASGVPVLSSPVIADQTFDESVNVISNLEPEAVAEAIARARCDRQLQAAKASSAREYVERHHLWPAIGEEVVGYFNRL